MSRKTLLESKIDGTVELNEFLGDGESGNYDHQIVLKPLRHRTISASTFSNRNHHSMRTSEIVIFVDGFEYKKSLLPYDFVKYSKLVFQLETRNRLKVMGIRPVTLTDNLSRLPFLGFLDNNHDKEPELIFYTTPRFARTN